MSAISNTLKSFSDFVSLKAAGEKEIAEAEKQLNLSFASEYKEYTAEFGAAAANGHEITGAVSPKRLNVVAETKRGWEHNPQVPHSMYVIENAGIDGVLIWQDGSGTVYQSAPNRKPVKIAASIAEYILEANQ